MGVHNDAGLCRPSRGCQLSARLCDTAAARAQVVYGHLDDPENAEMKRGVSYLRLRPGERLDIPSGRGHTTHRLTNRVTVVGAVHGWGGPKLAHSP